MATIDARQQQFFATTAAWQANDIVLLAGEMGFELRTDNSIIAKVGDGVTQFSLLTAQTSWVMDSGTSDGQTVMWKDARWQANDALLLDDTSVRVNDVDLQIYSPTYGQYRMAMTIVDGHNILAITSQTENMGVQINARTDEGTVYSLKVWPNGELRWNNKVIAGPEGGVMESGATITDATIHGVITGDCSQFVLPSAGAGFATVGASNLATDVGSLCKIGDFGVIIPDDGAAAQGIANQVVRQALLSVVLGMADITGVPQAERDQIEALINAL